MRSLIFCLVIVLSGTAFADELADANKALDAKAYPQALQLFSKLAAAGNPEAQLRLGEMYWYGEGVALDRARGDTLIAQAAAGGNPEAAVARSLSARRAQHGADIAYWTGGYDGADLTAGKYNCVAPAIPTVSTTNADIKAVNDAMATWRACYEAFAEHLKSALPPGKRIPPEIVVVMSEQETQQARTHLDKIYAAVTEKANASAVATLARREQWEAATLVSVAEQNSLAEARTRQAKVDLEQQKRLREDANALNRATPTFRQK